MTKYQGACYHMFHTTREVCDAHNADWRANAPFTTTYALYPPMLEALHAAIVKQGAVNTGPAASKSQARDVLEAGAFANAGYAYAGSVADRALMQELAHTRKDFDRATEPELVGLATNIFNRLRALPAQAVAPYGITPATLDALNAQRDAFDGLIGAPGAAHAETREGTDEVAAQMRRISTFLRERLDAVARLLMPTAPAFVDAYFIGRTIHDPAERTRALEVRVTDAATGGGLGAVEATIQPGALRKRTTPLGAFYVQDLPARDYTMAFSKYGYVEETQRFSVNDGETTEVAVELRRAAE